MGAISGIGGFVEASGGAGPDDGSKIAEITTWTFTTTSNNSAWASSTDPGYKKRVGGVRDCSGTVNGKFNGDIEQYNDLEAGSSVTLTLKINTANYYAVPAIIDEFNIEVDMDNGEVVGWSMNFSGNGAWSVNGTQVEHEGVE